MAFNAWMQEDFGDTRFDLGRLVYEYMVRYYFRSAHFSRVMVPREAPHDVLSFLLAYRPQEQTPAQDWLEKQLSKVSATDAQVALQYQRYLSTQSQRISDLAQEQNYLIAGLFISRRPGCGSPLMRALLEQAQNEGFDSLYLWADANCNCQYYQRHGFVQAARFEQSAFIEDQKLDIVVFKKEFQR